MSLFTLFMLLIASTVVTLTVLTVGFPSSKGEEAKQEPAKDIRGKQLRFVSILVGIFLPVAAGLVYGMVWVGSTAPPDYISQKIAKSQDPECLKQRLGKVIESRALNRHEVMEASKVCNRGTKSGVPTRLQQKEALQNDG